MFATNYANATVAQAVTAGAAVTANTMVSQQPVGPAVSGGAFATQPKVTLKDQYNNTCTNGPSATANVVASAAAGTGTWTIGGTLTQAAVAGVATFTDLTCSTITAGNGTIHFVSGAVAKDSSTFTIPASIVLVKTSFTTFTISNSYGLPLAGGDDDAWPVDLLDGASGSALAAQPIFAGSDPNGRYKASVVLTGGSANSADTFEIQGTNAGTGEVTISMPDNSGGRTGFTITIEKTGDPTVYATISGTIGGTSVMLN
ncbi:MAG: hypothetical protein ACM3PP_07045 [Candidatus Saccharibacteria bacterium]